MSRVLRLWWPLAASWLLMALELPLLTAVVARMADAEINLAAYSALVLPISLVIEAPIIMLLAASTVLSKDWASYLKLRRFTNISGAVLTAVHAGIAFSPLYDLVARDLMGLPEPVLEPARIGLRLMTPWTWAIANRRFHQGVLIRFERSRAVGIGTAVRLLANGAVLLAGYLYGGLSGIAVGASAVAVGVLAEAGYVRWAVQPVLEDLRGAPALEKPLTRAGFLRFYLPLAATPLLTLLIQPLGAAAMARMPHALPSLAAWPAVFGLVFVLRSVGFAYNEVVVALCGEPGAVPTLRRFAWRLAAVTVAILGLIAATPLAEVYFGHISGLSEELTALSASALAVAILMPGYAALISWYQGVLVHGHETRSVTEAVALYLVVAAALLTIGTRWVDFAGIYYALGTFTVAGVIQTLWLRWRCAQFLNRT